MLKIYGNTYLIDELFKWHPYIPSILDIWLMFLIMEFR